MSERDEQNAAVRCPICGGRDLEGADYEAAHLLVAPDRRVWRCGGCTHVFLHPPGSDEELARLYTADYYAAFEAGAGMAGDRGDEAAPHLRRRLERVERWLGGRRLLDVGCGKGSFLSYAASRGWSVVGIDVSADAVEFVRRHRGLEAHRAEIDAGGEAMDEGTGVPPGGVPSGAFDFIHANHVIEHLCDPLAALRRLRGRLDPAGMLTVEVPNEFENLFFVLGRRMLPAERMRRRDPSPHMQFFTPRSLRRALETAGFRVMSLRTRRWQVGWGDGLLVRTIKRAVALAERVVGRGGNIVAVARSGDIPGAP